MKQEMLLIIMMMVISINLNGQEQLPINENGVYEIREVIEINATKERLYSSILTSMVSIFNDSEEIIEFKDKNEGIIIGKFNVKTAHLGAGSKNHYFKFKIRFDIKNNKYRMTVIYFSHKAIWANTNMDYACPNDISQKTCGERYTIGNKEWNIQKLDAHKKLVKALEMLKINIIKEIKTLEEVDCW